jgi:PST family polysaccharide transporter
MNVLSQLVTSWKGDRFLRNIGWMGLSEFFIRLSRLVTTVILARFLSPEDYGLAAIVLTSHEFVRVFTRNGIIDKIIQSDADELEGICRTAYSLNWLIATVLFVGQCLAALAIAGFYGNTRLIAPICLVSFTYLIYPWVAVNVGLIRRENRLHILALITSIQISVDNLLTALFALSGWGMWAIVAPKLIVAPLWVGLFLYYHPWRMGQSFTLKYWRRITGFSTRILGIELLTTFRENVDYLLIGHLVGVQALGVYYFAFNAGLGMSLSVINAIRVSLFSDLCTLKSNAKQFTQRYTQSLCKIALVIVPLVVLQASLAPFYVPLVFGSQWVSQGAVPILMVICCSALSRPFADAASLMFRAFGRPYLELRWNVLFTGILATAIWVGTYWGILGAAIAVLLTHLLLQPLYTAWATCKILRQFLPEAVV